MWLIPHVVIVLSTPVSGTSCSHHSLPEPYRLWLAEMVDIRSFIVFLSTAVLMASTNLPRYRTLHSKVGKRDTLTGSEAVNAVLTTDTAALCSLILFVDGKTSSRAVLKMFGNLKTSEDIVVFEVAGTGQDFNVTRVKLCKVVDQARWLRQMSWCMKILVVSDDIDFLSAFAECSLEGRLLVWSNRLLAVTRLSLQQLQQLHEIFSQTNSILLLVNDIAGYLQCNMYIHLPYTPRDTKALQIAYWTPKRGLVLTTHLPIFPDKFKYKIMRPPDGGWGAKMQDGTWNGMVGMVVRKEVDFGLGPFGVTAVRYEVVDYTRPVVIDYGRIMARRGRSEVDPWGFMLPLAPLVWAATLTALLLLLSILFLLSKCCSYLHIRQDNKTYGVLDYLRVLLQQDILVEKGSWWQRMLLITWMMVTLVLTRCYSGNLMSLLSVRYSLQPYQSLQDAVNDPSVALIWETNTAYIQALKSATSGIYKAVADLDKKGRNVYMKYSLIPESIDTLVRRGDHVLIMEELTEEVLIAKDFSNTGRCDFYLSKERDFPLMFALVGLKNSPLVPVLSNRECSWSWSVATVSLSSSLFWRQLMRGSK